MVSALSVIYRINRQSGDTWTSGSFETWPISFPGVPEPVQKVRIIFREAGEIIFREAERSVSDRPLTITTNPSVIPLFVKSYPRDRPLRSPR